ncbi:MAG: CHAT domain-containing tetratricopeptide repeat protein [Planctomycetota bacterium]
MSWSRWSVLLVIATLGSQGVPPAVATADDPPGPAAPPNAPVPPPQAAPGLRVARRSAPEIAAQVVRAASEMNAAKLAVLATEAERDVWLVIDELEALGDMAAARAFGAALPKECGTRVLAYLGTDRPAATAPTVRARLQALDAVKEPIDGLPSWFQGDVSPPAGTVLELRCYWALARALARTGSTTPALNTYQHATRLALALDCLEIEASTMAEAPGVALAAGFCDTARRLLEELLSRQEVRGTPLARTRTRLNLGHVAANAGDLPRAQREFEAAIAGFRALNRPVQAASARSARAAVLALAGSFSESLHEQSRALAELETLAPESTALAECLLRLGNLHWAMSDRRTARTWYTRALARMEALKDAQGVASAKGNLALWEHEQGESAAALQLLEDARDAFAKSGDTLNALWADENRAQVLSDVGDPTEAQAAHQGVLGKFVDRNLPVGAACALEGIGRACIRAHDFVKAAEHFQRALSEAERLDAYLIRVSAMAGLVEAHSGAGRAREAVAAALALVDAQRRYYAELPQSGGVGSDSRIVDAFESAIDAAFDLQDKAAMQQLIEAVRGHRLLKAMGGRERLRQVVMPTDIRAREDALRTAAIEALARLRSAFGGGNTRETRDELRRTYETNLAQAALVWQEFLASLELDTLAGLLTPRTSDISAIQARLAPDEQFVYYASGRRRQYALVISKSTATAHRLEDLNSLRAELDAFHPDDDTVDPSAAALSLRRKLLDPLAIPRSTRTLLICPDELTAYVPFLLLDDTRAYAFEPSGSVYDALMADRIIRGTKALILANPSYAALVPERLAAARNMTSPLAALPGTLKEIPIVRRDAADIVLQGDGATVPALRDTLARHATTRFSVVHFGCHGIVDRQHPARSVLALTPTAADDGLLDAAEIFRLRIRSDLIVLSACDTASDRHDRGEGLSGLVRAFFYAGTPRIVASLWKINDSTAPNTMEQFYREFRSGVGVAESLRRAQRGTNVPAARPRLWASWVLFGVPGVARAP